MKATKEMIQIAMDLEVQAIAKALNEFVTVPEGSVPADRYIVKDVAGFAKAISTSARKLRVYNNAFQKADK